MPNECPSRRICAETFYGKLYIAMKKLSDRKIDVFEGAVALLQQPRKLLFSVMINSISFPNYTYSCYGF